MYGTFVSNVAAKLILPHESPGINAHVFTSLYGVIQVQWIDQNNMQEVMD